MRGFRLQQAGVAAATALLLGLGASAPASAAGAAAIRPTAVVSSPSAAATPAREAGKPGKRGKKPKPQPARKAVTEIRGWNTTGATVPPGQKILDRVAVRTGGSGQPRRIEVRRSGPGDSGWVRVASMRTDDLRITSALLYRLS